MQAGLPRAIYPFKGDIDMDADLFDIVYFSGRKFGFARGGAVLVRDETMFHSMEDLIPMFEGFLTYGGMSVKEMEALTVGFDESMEMDVIDRVQWVYHPFLVLPPILTPCILICFMCIIIV